MHAIVAETYFALICSSDRCGRNYGVHPGYATIGPQTQPRHTRWRGYSCVAPRDMPTVCFGTSFGSPERTRCTH